MMSIKRILLLFVATLCITNALAIDQLGVAYRYNGKKQRSAIGGVYVKVATSPNGVVSEEPNGRFMLKLQGLGMGDPMGLATVAKKGMMVFNKEEVDRWSVQKKPLVLIVCDANEFQKQKDQLIAIGRAQSEKKYKQKLAKLEAQNAKNLLTLEQYYAKLDSIEKEKNNALAHMDEYADLFARIDESEIDTIAQKAVDLFKQGYIDEAIALFKKNDPIAKIKKSVRIRKQAEEMRQLADSADALAQQDIDENMKNAKAYIAALKLKNDWEEAGRLLKELADALGTLEAMWEYADFSLLQKQYAEAEAYYKLCKDKIAVLVKTNPEVYEPQLADISNNLGTIYYKTQRFDESEQMYKDALDVDKRLADANPQFYEPDLVVSYNNLANLYGETQRFTESEQMYKDALEISKRLVKSNPQANERGLAASYLNLASLYMRNQRFTESEKIYKSAVEIYKRLAESNPQTYGLALAPCYYGLATLYKNTQRYEESELMYKSVLGIFKRLAESNPQTYEPVLAEIYDNLARLYWDTQRYAESEQMFKLALGIFKRLVETNPQTIEPALAISYQSIADLYYTTQRYAESEQMYKAAITIDERLYEDVPQQFQSRLAKGYLKYGMAMINNNKYHDAIGPFERSLKLCKDMMNDETGKSLYVANLAWLVDLYNNDKDYATAYTYNKELLPLLKTNYGEDANTWKTDYHGKLISQSFYANLLGKFEEGELHSLEALKVDSTQHLAYTNLAAAYLLQGKYQDAEKLYRQYKNEFKEGLLTDFDELAKAGVIPSERMADVEKIKKMLNE